MPATVIRPDCQGPRPPARRGRGGSSPGAGPRVAGARAPAVSSRSVGTRAARVCGRRCPRRIDRSRRRPRRRAGRARAPAAGSASPPPSSPPRREPMLRSKSSRSRRTANGAPPPEAMASCRSPRRTRAGRWKSHSSGTSATLTQMPRARAALATLLVDRAITGGRQHELAALHVRARERARMQGDRTLGGKPRDGLDHSGSNNRHPCTLRRAGEQLAVRDLPCPHEEAAAAAQVEHHRVHGAVAFLCRLVIALSIGRLAVDRESRATACRARRRR